MIVLLLASALGLVGFINLGIARDKLLWVSYAVESFRYCTAFGYLMLSTRIFWIHFVGDEPGVSLWGGSGLAFLALGQLGMQMNNLSTRTIHVPKFVRGMIE